MGVVHKLRKEVVNFIVNQKRKNPQLSCRALTELTSETFELHLSKSSVNNILKKANLSSGVGRRAGQKTDTKKFKIPPQKKTQLFKNVQKEKSPKETKKILGLSLKKTTSSKSAEKKASNRKNTKEKIDLKEKIKQLTEADTIVQINNVDKKGLSANGERIVSQVIPEEPLRNFKKELFHVDAKKIVGNVSQKQGWGLIIFKAMLEELSTEPVLGALFKEYFSQDFPSLQPNLFNLAFLQYFAGENINEKVLNEPNHAIWSLFQYSDLAQFINFFSKVQEARLPQEKEMEIVAFLDQCFTDITAFELILSDSQRLFIDSEMKSLSLRYPLQSQGISLNRAISLLSRYLIANNESAIIQQALSSSPEEDPLKLFLEAFDLRGKEIKKIKLLRGKQETLTSFSIIPLKRREFSLGLYPKSRAFQLLTQEDLVFPEKDKKRTVLEDSFCKDILGQEVFYRASTNTFIKGRDGGIFDFDTYFVYFERNLRPELAIITNDREHTPQEIILAYLKKYPDGIHTVNFNNNVNNIKNNLQTQNDLLENSKKTLFSYFEKKFEKYCLKRLPLLEKTLHDAKSFMRMLYETDSCIIQKENYVTVILFEKENFQFSEIYAQMMKLINNGNFIDEKGRQIYLKYVSN